MRLLAIDPGYERVGIAIIERKEENKETLLHSECFKTSSKIPHIKRLYEIGKHISEVIKEFNPKALAIEKLFFNTNQKTALGVAEARGVILYSASLTTIPVFEYTPLEIKMAVTGYGKSDKKQMMSMIPRLIEINKKIISDDEFDAIACGLTFFAVEKPH